MLKTIAKFWKHQSRRGSTYYRLTLREPLPAGAKLLLFRRDGADDDSAGSVCLAVDDELDTPIEQSQAVANRGGRYRSPGVCDDRFIMAEEDGVSMAREAVALRPIPEENG